MANTLQVSKRQSGGKGPARRLRASGKIPAVVYGHGKENVDVTLDSRGFEKFLATLRSEAELISLRLDGESDGERLTLIKALQRHPVSDRIVHVDFFEINPNEQIHISVPLHFVGTPVGVVDQGGMLEFLQRELPIVCLPRHIPSVIDVDITGLAANTAIHVAELKLPENVITREDPKKALAHVITKLAKEEPQPAAEGAAATEAAAAPAAT
jgi:large subunit ribosomal protein L25